jgi:protein-S-isoprenylcysteine O-methyltransferase Ste14
MHHNKVMGMTAERKRKIWEKSANIAACFIYALFMLASVMDFMNTHRPSSLIAAVFAMIIAHFLLLRPAPARINVSAYDWAVAFGGTYLPLLMRPVAGGHDVLALQLLQALGAAITVWGALSLNKSFGLVAANRGVKTGGIYKYIRHPLYAGYFLQFTGFCAQNPAVFNAVAFCAWLCFELARIFAEEKYLSRDPAYAAYMKSTRWRILPGLF